MSGGMDLVQTCPYCRSPVELKHSSAVYRNGKDYGMMYVCSQYPKCDSYVGCHPNSSHPLGMLASAELRQARQRAHASFDRIWKAGLKSRTQAYKWLKRAMALEAYEAHIGQMNARECAHVVAVVEQFFVEQYEAGQKGWV